MKQAGKLRQTTAKNASTTSVQRYPKPLKRISAETKDVGDQTARALKPAPLKESCLAVTNSGNEAKSSRSRTAGLRAINRRTMNPKTPSIGE